MRFVLYFLLIATPFCYAAKIQYAVNTKMSDDGRYALIFDDGKISTRATTWDLLSNRSLWAKTPNGNTWSFSTGEFFPDNERLALMKVKKSASEFKSPTSTILILDINSGEILKESAVLEGEWDFENIIISPDQKYVIAMGYYNYVWDLTADIIFKWEERTKQGVAFLDSSRVITYQYYGKDKAFHIRQLPQGEVIDAIPHAEENWIEHFALSSSNRYIAVLDKKKVTVIDLVKKKGIHSFNALDEGRGDHHKLTSVKVTPDEQFILTAGGDYYVKLWDLQTGKFIRNEYEAKGCVTSLGSSEISSTIVVTSRSCGTRYDGVYLNQPEKFELCCSHRGYAKALESAAKKLNSNSKLVEYDAFFDLYDNEINNLYVHRRELFKAVRAKFEEASFRYLAGLQAPFRKNMVIDFINRERLVSTARSKAVQVLIDYYIEEGNLSALLVLAESLEVNSADIEYLTSQVYEEVKPQNSIAGYNWFIAGFAQSQEAIHALKEIHRLAFELAEDIDTINAYNDFVIAYPTAKQVREANERAYDLEKSEYVGMLSYFSEEKDARRLLVQSKMLEQSAEDLSSEQRVGYMMVVNRMNDLLKQEFNSTDAALRHLESNEFKSFVRTFKRSMKDLKRQVSRIADNTADLSSIMKQQSSMMNNHFENAAQDREMASELTKQHRFWERFIGEVGQ